MAGTTDTAKANLNIDTSVPLSPENQVKVDVQKQTDAVKPEQKPTSQISGFSAPVTSSGSNPKAFMKAMQEMDVKMQNNNKLIQAKNAAFKHMYDQPLTEEEKGALTPGLQHAISTGNRTLIDTALTQVNEQLKGYRATLDTNLLTYGEKYAELEKAKQDAAASFMDYRLKGATDAQLADMTIAMGYKPEEFGISGKISIPETSRLAYVNNNPGNLKFVGQVGATMGEGGFAKFESPEAGYQALQSQISLDASRGQTLSQFINKYAPPTENDTNLYIQQAQQQLGVSANTPLAQIDINKLTQFMANKESGTKMSYGETAIVEDTTLSDNPETQSIIQQAGLSLPAFNYLTQGTSSMSRMTADQRNKIMAEATDFLNKKGIDVSTFQSQYKTYNEVLGNNISRQNKTQIMEKELVGTIDNLTGVVNDKEMGKINVANVLKVWSGQQVNDSLATQYAFHFQQLKNELAGYFAASQGKNSPDVIDNQDAALTIVNGMGAGSLKGLKESIVNSTGKMKDVLDSSVNETRKSVWDLFGVGDKYKDVVKKEDTSTTFSDFENWQKSNLTPAKDNNEGWLSSLWNDFSSIFK